MAAVLACGPRAVLSHRSAGALLDLVAAGIVVDVTSPSRAGRSRPGIRAHGGVTLMPDDVTSVAGIPCTTIARTLIDLAEVLDRQALARACERAEILRVFDGRAIDRALERSRGRRGAAILGAVLGEWNEPSLPRREFERRFFELCAAAGLPRPEDNVWLELDDYGCEVDFIWREERVIVETDGRAFHGTRAAFERDRERDQRLLAAGFVVMRLTWRQVVEQPQRVAATIRALLARSAS